MFLIVFGHCCLYLNVPDAKVGKTLSIPGVFATDAFILISGWFGVRFSVRKVLKFLGLGLFACFVVTLASRLTNVQGRYAFSLGWFGNCYLALMLLSPLINAGLDKLREEKLLGRAWCFYAVAMLLAWIPVKGLGVSLLPTGWAGISFNTMCFVYVTGRVLRDSEVLQQELGWKSWLSIFVGLMVLNLGWSWMAQTASGEVAQSIFVGTKDYDSPIVLGLPVSFFMLMRTVRLPNWISSVVFFVAPSMFSIYLIHEGCNGALSRAIYNRYVNFGFGGGFVQIALQILIASVIVFTACLVIDLMRRAVLWSIGNIKK